MEDCLSKRIAALPAVSRLVSSFVSSSESKCVLNITHAGQLLRPTTGMELLWLMSITGLELSEAAINQASDVSDIRIKTIDVIDCFV